MLEATSGPTTVTVRAVPAKASLLAGLGLLWLIFWVGFIAWWRLMSLLFQRGDYGLAVAVAYALPAVYTLATFVASKIKGRYLKLLHFFTLFVLTLVFAIILAFEGATFPWEPGAYIGMALIAIVIALMQYPKVGLRQYEVYKTTLFLGGVIFMPLFIYFGAMLPNVPHTPALDKVWLFPIGMLGFWLSGAWLASRMTQGGYVPGLEIKPLMPFRPDFILPGGVLLVKGTVLLGMGLMIAGHEHLGMPRWNWWGFVLAFWGIITLIPLLGMYKMVKGKRARMLGLGGIGFGHELVKGLILFVGLNILLYGFANAFAGPMPFTLLGRMAMHNAFLRGDKPGDTAAAIGVITFLLSFGVLVFLRGWYKLRLREGAESWGQLFIKQLLLYTGVVLLIMAYLHLLFLEPVHKTGYFLLFPNSNPYVFYAGSILFLAGTFLILVLRPLALRNEFEAMVATMVGVISDSGERVRRWVMENRIKALTAMPMPQRDIQVKLMIMGLNSLPQEEREAMMKTQIEVLSGLEPQRRRLMMASMDKAIMGRG